eukprot:1160942-Pelagomonas_calceolata.AAC.2
MSMDSMSCACTGQKQKLQGQDAHSSPPLPHDAMPARTKECENTLSEQQDSISQARALCSACALGTRKNRRAQRQAFSVSTGTQGKDHSHANAMGWCVSSSQSPQAQPLFCFNGRLSHSMRM